MARWLCAVAAITVLASGGCCCLCPSPCKSCVADCGPSCGPACGPSCGPSCGPRGGAHACCLCIPKPIVWCGNCNECGPSACEDCSCPSDCGLLACMRRHKSCGMGCSEIYWGEWLSDPPDCCDPCDQCYGQWTGHSGCCQLGPFQHLLAACHGYSYCPKPCCNEGCGLCNKSSCATCGGGRFAGPEPGGCATCGGGHGGAIDGDMIYEGQMPGNFPPPANLRTPPAPPRPAAGQPVRQFQTQPQFTRGPAPRASQPIHAPPQVSRSQPKTMRPAPQPAAGRMVKTAGYQR
jgi:hypothetical protein